MEIRNCFQILHLCMWAEIHACVIIILNNNNHVAFTDIRRLHQAFLFRFYVSHERIFLKSHFILHNFGMNLLVSNVVPWEEKVVLLLSEKYFTKKKVTCRLFTKHSSYDVKGKYFFYTYLHLKIRKTVNIISRFLEFRIKL